MSNSKMTQADIPRRHFVEATHTSVVAAGVILAVAGWTGLVWVVSNQLPTIPYRWTFYALLQIALTGTALPFIRFLNKRFAPYQGLYITPGVLVRQASWVGIFITTCAWLRISRLLSLPLMILLVLALGAIEFLLRMRELIQLAIDLDIDEE